MLVLTRVLIAFTWILLSGLSSLNAASLGPVDTPSAVGSVSSPSQIGPAVFTASGCGAGSGETVIGIETYVSASSKTAGTYEISKFTADNDCDVDDLNFDVYGLTDSEHMVIGLYDSSCNKIYQTSEQTGVAGGGDTTITGSITSYSLSSGTSYHIVSQADGGFNAYYSNTDGTLEGTKNISGSYSSTLPASLDCSGLTTGYSFTMYGATP